MTCSVRWLRRPGCGVRPALPSIWKQLRH
uniref:Uncharacterized protein n=1 Tax=Arundo donax TaxID=35708 RepID=A0A0A9BHI0_ARUDO